MVKNEGALTAIETDEWGRDEWGWGEWGFPRWTMRWNWPMVIRAYA